ncbi:spore coat protein CotJB [Clostridium sp. Sa3CUN1]|uniref:Spore coat protein CotJB n=1 Tax=Clostridium gallinarum TaxID=2762246 RepID=A0ABR8Q192_9CLOT|nr:spore coat protein CotJB [Clostridium gallinarum]MBD7914195.1 spore coat protein CotJB [Clostridium gallinarum]
MTKHEYLDKIYRLQFFIVDLNLYLDNFPTCEKAKSDYENISCELKKTIWDYEKEHGPLTNFGSAYFQNPEKWVNSPWPWEKSKGGKK